MNKSKKFKHASDPMKDIDFWEDDEGYSYHEDPSKMKPFQLLAEIISQEAEDITILEKHSNDARNLSKDDLIAIIEILTGRLSQSRRSDKMLEADR